MALLKSSVQYLYEFPIALLTIKDIGGGFRVFIIKGAPEKESGAIVNTSSIAGLVAVLQQSIYVASKHVFSGLTKSAAVECRDRGVRINAMCPGLIDTPLMGRIYASNPELKAETDN